MQMRLRRQLGLLRAAKVEIGRKNAPEVKDVIESAGAEQSVFIS